jgi:hypothetical protein
VPEVRSRRPCRKLGLLTGRGSASRWRWEAPPTRRPCGALSPRTRSQPAGREPRGSQAVAAAVSVLVPGRTRPEAATGDTREARARGRGTVAASQDRSPTEVRHAYFCARRRRGLSGRAQARSSALPRAEDRLRARPAHLDSRVASLAHSGLEPVGNRGRGPRGSQEPPPPSGGSSSVGAHQKHTRPPAAMRACGRGFCPQTTAPSRRPAQARCWPGDTRWGSKPASSTAFSAAVTDRPLRSGTSPTGRRRLMASRDGRQPEPGPPRRTAHRDVSRRSNDTPES